MRRTWAIYDVYLGHPVLVQRCSSKEEATKLVEKKGPQSCGSLYMVEQVLPDGPRLVSVGADHHGTSGDSEAT